MFGSNQSLETETWNNVIGDSSTLLTSLEADDYDDEDGFTFNILTDNNFFSQVIHKTNGGQLPFVFQPDTNDFTNLIIAKLDMKSFQFKQVAHNTYNCSVTVREIW